MNRSGRFFKILLTVLIILVAGYFIFTATRVELPPENTASTVEKAGAE